MRTLAFQKKIVILLFIFLVFGCGPSGDEIRRKADEIERANEEIFKKLAKEAESEGKELSEKYKTFVEEYRKKLYLLKSKLQLSASTTVYTGTMNPVLNAGSKEGNLMVISYDCLDGSKTIDKADAFGLYSDGEAITALNNFIKIDAGLGSDVIGFTDDIASRLNINITPYVLITRRLSIEDVKMEDSKTYSGGETLGAAWLADIRTMEILGCIRFKAEPGDVKIMEKDKNTKLNERVKRSADGEGRTIITDWLQKYKGADIK